MGFEPMTFRPMEALVFRANGVNHSAIEPLGITPHRTYKSLKSNLFFETTGRSSEYCYRTYDRPDTHPITCNTS